MGRRLKRQKRMEAFEFLGGRYNRPEQIMSGPVQAFKAQNAANGRSVFIHRVSTTEAAGEQAALLKLLTTALVKSGEAKRLVLDFGEESGYWYVVTESEPQCALLREWLQLEIDAAFAGSKAAGKAVTPAVSPAPTQKADPGEFTRFLQRPSVSAGGTPSKAAPAPPPGEFTSFFNASERPAVQGQPQRPSSVPLPDLPQQPPQQPKTEPGEFTRFFTPGLPAAPPKQTPQVMNFERPANNPYVQRPNSPAPPLPPPQSKAAEPGEFTRMFSRPDHEPTASVRSDPMGFAKPSSNQLNDLSDNLFNSKINDKIEAGRPMTASQPEQGEFTKIFGAAGSEAPKIAPPAVVAAQREQPLLDEAQSTRQLPVMRPQAPGTLPASGSPSEFTMIMQGGYGQQKPAAGAPTPVAQAQLPTPPADLTILREDKAAANKKLMLFFAVLGVLALVLVVAVMFLMKSK